MVLGVVVARNNDTPKLVELDSEVEWMNEEGL